MQSSRSLASLVPIRATVDIMDSRAILRMDIGCYTGIILRAPLKSLCMINVLLATSNIDRSPYGCKKE